METTENTKSIPGRFAAPVVVNFEKIAPPEFVEVKGADWILLGNNNDYADYLLNLYNGSAKHNAIIQGKNNYTTGAGWDADEEGLSPAMLLKLRAFLANVNQDSESLHKISQKCDLDRKIFGGYYLEIIWNNAGSYPASIKHIPYTKMRSNKDNSIFYYCDEWLDKNGKANRKLKIRSESDKEGNVIVIPAFNAAQKQGRQILFYKTYHPDLDVYPLPEYIGAVANIETDIAITSYHLNNVKNGFVGTFMINFLNGMPTEEEQQSIERKIKDKFCGNDNAGKFVMNFADGKEKAAEIIPISMSDADKVFMELSKWTQGEIFTGHRITSPMLFGIRTEGQLGGRSEMVDAYELFKNTYVKPQQLDMEIVFNTIAKLYGFSGRIWLKQSEPIAERLTEATLTKILTDGELRIMVGYPEKRPGGDSVPAPVVPAANKKFETQAQKDLSQCIIDVMAEGKDQDQAVAICISKQQRNQLEYLPIFQKYGRPKSEFEILNKRFIHSFSKIEVIESELSIAKGFFYSANERAIIDLLEKDPLMPPEEIAKTLKISVDKVNSMIDSLENDGAIEKPKDPTLPMIILPKGKEIIDLKPAKTAEIEVMYSYEWAPGFNNSMISTSRDFCKELLSQDKLYTREDIEAISAEVDQDVWTMRGGWYTKPGTNIHIPHCRHLWQQNIVTRK